MDCRTSSTLSTLLPRADLSADSVRCLKSVIAPRSKVSPNRTLLFYRRNRAREFAVAVRFDIDLKGNSAPQSIRQPCLPTARSTNPKDTIAEHEAGGAGSRSPTIFCSVSVSHIYLMYRIQVGLSHLQVAQPSIGPVVDHAASRCARRAYSSL